MRFLGSNQLFDAKLPVSEFDGLQALLQSQQTLRHTKTTSRYVRGYYTQNTNFFNARNSTASWDYNASCLIGAHYWSNGFFYIYQPFHTLQVDWWSTNYQLASAQVTFEVAHNNTQGANPLTLYLLGFLNDFTQYQPWNNIINANGYRELGSFTSPAPPTGASIDRPFATGQIIYLSIPVTNLSGMKALLDSAVTTNNNLLRLLPVTQHLRDNVIPPGSNNNYYSSAFRCTLDLYWSAP